MLVTLFKQDAAGSIRSWTIEGVIDGSTATIEIEHGLVGGAKQTQTETILQGLAGRDLKEQMMSRMASRIFKQRDRGYVNKIEEAKAERPTNQLNLKMPMLAQKFNGAIPDEFYLQCKYDGNRCLIHNDGSRIIAYTRAGKENPNLDHITDNIDIPVGDTLDGELYCHGVPLQTLRSWISRKQEDTSRLEYIAYDIMTPEPYSKRLERLYSLNLEGSISIARTILISRFNLELGGGIKSILREFRESGYEGLMIRHGSKGYEDGKRSSSLIKVKDWEDGEFTIVDILSSADGWAILVCMCEGGTFKVSAPGSIAEKEQVLKNKQDYIGRQVTVEYAYLTKDKKPFQPTAIAFRDNGE